MSPKEEKMRAIQASAAGRIIESADARQIGEAVLVTPTCARPLAKESKPTYMRLERGPVHVQKPTKGAPEPDLANLLIENSCSRAHPMLVILLLYVWILLA